MVVLIKIAQFLLSLSLLIVLHELGHFLAARMFHTRVEKFFLFFDAWGKKLFSIKKGDTEYGIGWLPLGGYVKIAGMIDESMDKEQLKQPPKPDEFRSKPAWQRLIIMLGGVTVNFILGFLIYSLISYSWGEYYVPQDGVKYGFSTTETFHKLGFKDGDKILKINDKEIEDPTTINKILLFRNVKSIEVQHEDGTHQVIPIPEEIGHMMFEKGEMQAFTPRLLPVIDSVIPGSPADRAGLQKGDLITAVNEENTPFAKQVSNSIDNSPITLKFIREGKEYKVDVTPEYNDEAGRPLIGIIYDTKQSIMPEHRSFSLAQSIGKGIQVAYDTLYDLVSQFKYVFTKKGATQVGGFITIGKIFPGTWDWQSFWGITAFLSLMLGFMNLLPIPALDGGHALFVLVEMITGRKPSDKFLEYAQLAGFVLLISLLLWANGNDIYKLIFK
jgi:regulator of sigma E protease